MRETAIRVTKELHDRASRCAARAGYASTQEFIVHAIEMEVARLEDDNGDSKGPAHQLQGIGYLDAGLDI